MSYELVFISHHKNGAVCVTARMLLHNRCVVSSIMDNRDCARDKRREGVGCIGGDGRRRRDALRMLWCICSLSGHRSEALEMM